MPRALSREQLEMQERETPAFTARTLLDDMVGKLDYVRNQIWMELPEGFEGLLHDAEEAVEKLLIPVEGLELPANVKRLWVNLGSDSKVWDGEGCSCGAPHLEWKPTK